MSNLVTFEHAKKLKKLGFDEEIYKSYYKDGLDLNDCMDLDFWNYYEYYISAPTVSSALD
jgi:hypothetical protein